MTVRVVGAGVVGLSCAVRLAEAGHQVDLLTRDLPANTTSAAAGAVWLPYRVEPADRVADWGAATLAELLRLAAEPASGVFLRDGLLLYRTPPDRPSWADAVAHSLQLRPVRDPAPGYGHGFALRAPVMDVPVYLDYLLARVQRAGGRLVHDQLAALPGRGIVVNAAGLEAARLAGDPDVYPVRGQTVVLDNPGLRRWLVDEEEDAGELTYVLPRRADVVVGGSATEHDTTLAPDPTLAERMLARARALVPELAGATVRAHRVGLRPARPTVRLEAEPGTDGAVVHCYGHGGAGFTLSWGCADAVLALVTRLAG
jgi:D-amino-acid oxidase